MFSLARFAAQGYPEPTESPWSIHVYVLLCSLLQPANFGPYNISCREVGKSTMDDLLDAGFCRCCLGISIGSLDTPPSSPKFSARSNRSPQKGRSYGYAMARSQRKRPNYLCVRTRERSTMRMSNHSIEGGKFGMNLLLNPGNHLPRRAECDKSCNCNANV